MQTLSEFFITGHVRGRGRPTGSSDGIVTGRLARDLHEVMPDHLRRSCETGLELRALHVSSADILDTPDLMAALLRAPVQHMPGLEVLRRAA